jgi:signal transduction histidine kinase
LWRAVVALALFAAGIAAAAAMRRGLYANEALACLVAAWLGVLALRPDPPAAAAPDPTPPDVLAGQTELRRLRFMLDHAPVPLVLRAQDGALLAVNRAARRLFGVDERIDDPALAESIAAAQPGRRALVQLAERKSVATGASYALSVAHWSAAEGPALLAALVDIQAELQAAEAAALRELLETLSHEIMNSLTPVMSLAESAATLLEQGGANGAAPALDAVQTIARRARGLDRFVQGYRALARVPAALPRPASTQQLLADIALLFETRWRATSVKLEVIWPEPDIVVAIDSDLICQALMALLTNGAEAALAVADRPPRVTLTADMDGGMLWFRVADSGAGVPRDHAETIFRALFTLKPGGTGIGLGVARQIARGHGGDVLLEPSVAGCGARFAMYVR